MYFSPAPNRPSASAAAQGAKQLLQWTGPVQMRLRKPFMKQVETGDKFTLSSTPDTSNVTLLIFDGGRRRTTSKWKPPKQNSPFSCQYLLVETRQGIYFLKKQPPKKTNPVSNPRKCNAIQSLASTNWTTIAPRLSAMDITCWLRRPRLAYAPSAALRAEKWRPQANLKKKSPGAI